MKQLLIVAFALLVAACGKSASTDTVDSLVANPQRLRELRAQCKADHAKVGDEVCGMVGEATRRRFMGSGTPYTTDVPRTPRQPHAQASNPGAHGGSDVGSDASSNNAGSSKAE